jgi:nitrite reductase/ring-hydroxylating ferredoxin subunit
LTTRAELPIPQSWYAVAFADELAPGALLTRRLAGGEIVVFRTRSGKVAVSDPFCPHLGAHLGYGGTVVGEELRCPFHGFRFDTSGACTATGYGTKPPPRARLRMWLSREVNGIVFVWYDPQGEAPSWEPAPLDTRGWTPLIHTIFALRDHVQETVENGVDIGHFGIVHGYSDVRMLRELLTDGPRFSVSYAARRPMPVLGRLGAQVAFSFDLAISGLGYSLVTTTVQGMEITTRLFILATPTEPGRIELRLGLSLREITRPERLHPLALMAPRPLLNQLIARSILAALAHDVRQDIPIWEHKRYLERPALAEGDGPIGRFRQWARQFYPPLPPASTHHLPAVPALDEE